MLCEFSDVSDRFVRARWPAPSSSAAITIVSYTRITLSCERKEYCTLLADTMIASTTFDEWKRNNGVLHVSGFYETSWPQQLALAKKLYDEAYGSHPGFVPDDTSPEDVIKELQTAEYDPEKIVRWKGISVDWLLDVFYQTPFIQRLIEFDCDCWFVRDVCFIEFLTEQFSRLPLCSRRKWTRCCCLCSIMSYFTQCKMKSSKSVFLFGPTDQGVLAVFSMIPS